MDSESILSTTKKVLGLSDGYTAFDPDIIMHINSVFDVLNQMGVGPSEGFIIEDATKKWEDFTSPGPGLIMVRSYVYLRVRMLFDPAATSFTIDAMNKQISELEWRISVFREWNLAPIDPRVS